MIATQNDSLCTRKVKFPVCSFGVKLKTSYFTKYLSSVDPNFRNPPPSEGSKPTSSYFCLSVQELLLTSLFGCSLSRNLPDHASTLQLDTRSTLVPRISSLSCLSLLYSFPERSTYLRVGTDPKGFSFIIRVSQVRVRSFVPRSRLETSVWEWTMLK